MIDRCVLPLLLTLLAILIFYGALRMARRQVKAPLPAFLARVIDHPLRRLIQPLETTPGRHGVHTGMRVLEIGPGNGIYTLATARHLGPNGFVIALDIEPKLTRRLWRRFQKRSIGNLHLGVADAQHLPLANEVLNAACMMMVLGEIPEPERALRECLRALRPMGVLAVSEMLPDPDYDSAKRRIQMVESAGFHLLAREGSAFYYTLRFEKPTSSASLCRTRASLGV